MLGPDTTFVVDWALNIKNQSLFGVADVFFVLLQNLKRYAMGFQQQVEDDDVDKTERQRGRQRQKEGERGSRGKLTTR